MEKIEYEMQKKSKLTFAFDSQREEKLVNFLLF
jgi:hypothetical protein